MQNAINEFSERSEWFIINLKLENGLNAVMNSIKYLIEIHGAVTDRCKQIHYKNQWSEIWNDAVYFVWIEPNSNCEWPLNLIHLATSTCPTYNCDIRHEFKHNKCTSSIKCVGEANIWFFIIYKMWVSFYRRSHFTQRELWNLTQFQLHK